MKCFPKAIPGVLVCLAIAVPCWFLGQVAPVIGAPVFAILVGMLVAHFWKAEARGCEQEGIAFTSKKVLQAAVVLLGFGLNFAEIAKVGVTSLPIICSTIATALIVGYITCKLMRIPRKTAVLVSVGSSICGGSAIAATAPVVKANDEEIAQAISVIFLFNVLAALVFPTLGEILGLTNDGFGLFAGTAVNDTSSVTAAAAAWDGMHTGSNALDYATIVKLTRTLAIIPITLGLALWDMRAAKLAHHEESLGESGFSLRRSFPMFILLFLGAAALTTICMASGTPVEAFAPLKTAAKFLIVMAMAAIGLNTNVVKLVRTGGKPLLMGLICWVCITGVSLGMQACLGLW